MYLVFMGTSNKALSFFCVAIFEQNDNRACSILANADICDLIMQLCEYSTGYQSTYLLNQLRDY